MKNNRQRYEAPQAEIIVIETQGVLCASGGASTSKGGGTTDMDIQGYGW